MWKKLNIALLKTIILLVLVLLTTFFIGCGRKEIATKPIIIDKVDYSLAFTKSADFDKIATNENEAALMAWDLYAYIKELENALNACIAINKVEK